MLRLAGSEALSPRRPWLASQVLSALMLLTACGPEGSPAGSTASGTNTHPLATGMVPLNDLGAGTYLGFTGGLYPQGSNTMPAAHSAAGSARAAAIQPLDTAGNPRPDGKYVFLSIGMSHVTQEFCSENASEPCNTWSFTGKAAVDSAVNKTTLVMANGAMGGHTALYWDEATDDDYNRVRDTVLGPKGLSEKQVQIVWLKLANAGPSVSLPNTNADAYKLKGTIGSVLRAAKSRYPNLKQVFISSRSYGGYAHTTLNPEPYAYESGFAVKWAIEAQIRQMAQGTIDSRTGDLNYNSGVAPWVAWGPYLWADGETPRSDGLTWLEGNFESDGTHPERTGETKAAVQLLSFFKTSPHARCWFLSGLTCP